MSLSDQLFFMLIGIMAAAFAVIVIVYLYMAKKANNSKTKYLKNLVQTTQVKKFSVEIFYQKFYLFCISVPGLSWYTKKLRRRIEIINLGDEYLTRQQTSKVMSKIVPTVTISFITIILMTKGNMLLMSSLLLLLVFLVETLISGAVDKVENKLLKEQVDFFAEIRHAYHEYNMVEEAIYNVAQNDDKPEIGRQAEKIHEILLSDDPETNLEKYYDIAPNDYLKEFAGISYLTREFGDRQDENGASLYLKNLNNITQEMQIEILKRDRLDYVFQSLSVIALLPVLFIQPLKNWAVGTFGFTRQFYYGKIGMIMEIVIIILTTISYILVRKVKNNTNMDRMNNTSNPWQAKLYKKPIIKQVVNLFIPKRKTKEYREMAKLLKDSASKLKMEWLYTTKLTMFVLAFLTVFTLIMWSHMVAKDYVYTEPTADYDLLGNMGAADEAKAIQKTKDHNKVIEKLKNKSNLTDKMIEDEMKKVKGLAQLSESEKKSDIEKIKNKIGVIQAEGFVWYELLIAFALSFVAYYSPEMIMKFQKKMRDLEMENEVMQFHTIILMLMKIERVNVEMILEWIERYSNIFRDPISKCVNNFESGGYEALEQLKEDVSFPQFVRIVESLQAAVDKIPIREAFDELETERTYYQDKRKESNARLIERKARIGKVIGFAPMVTLFVGYLIVPMVGIGIVSMGEALSKMNDKVKT